MQSGSANALKRAEGIFQTYGWMDRWMDEHFHVHDYLLSSIHEILNRIM